MIKIITKKWVGRVYSWGSPQREPWGQFIITDITKEGIIITSIIYEEDFGGRIKNIDRLIKWDKVANLIKAGCWRED